MERRVPERARRALAGALEGLSALAAGRGDHALARRAAALRERLAADRLVVAVVGGFKRGKTTFVNALLGADVELLRGGALLVDTPGVGSVHRTNTETARSFLREVDAAILLTSQDPPISEPAVAFLRKVRDEAARVLFVMNKLEGTIEAIRAGIDRALADRRRSEERLRALREEAARALGDLAAIEERLDELDRVDRSEAAG